MRPDGEAGMGRGRERERRRKWVIYCSRHCILWCVVCLKNRTQGSSHFILFDFTNFLHRVAHFIHFWFEIARPFVKAVQTWSRVEESIDSSADIGHFALKLGNSTLYVNQCVFLYIHLPIQFQYSLVLCWDHSSVSFTAMKKTHMDHAYKDILPIVPWCPALWETLQVLFYMILTITKYRIFLPEAAENASLFSPACLIIASTFSAISNVFF